METERRRLSSRTALSKALQYALTRWDALARFTVDGRIGIKNNNPAEAGAARYRRDAEELPVPRLRPWRRTRRVITALDQRGSTASIEAWLTDVIDRLARGHSQRDIDALLPWNWQVRGHRTRGLNRAQCRWSRQWLTSIFVPA